MNNLIKIFFVLLLLASKAFNQNIHKIEINLFSNDSYVHYLHNNQEGFFKQDSIKSNIIFRNSMKYRSLSFELDWSINKENLVLSQISAMYSRKNINFKIGSFNQEKLYQNPTYSSGSMVFSNNAKKIPGISINSNWINFYDYFEFKAELFHGKFPKQSGYKGGPYLHYKSLLLKKELKKINLGFSIQHAVQHGGFDQYNEKIPSSFQNYINVFFARAGDESQPGQDQDYKAGNGLGAFTVFLDNRKDFRFYFEHYFDDKSGVKTLNLGDGLYGFEYYTNSLMFNFEIINTKNQSGNQHPPGVDSYYYHDVYTFGWSNNKHSIGNSFISPFSNRKFIQNSNLKIDLKNISLIIQYADAEIYIPYLDKNNNLPYENYQDVQDKIYHKMIGINYKLKNNDSISLNYGIQDEISNLVLKYLIEL